jgi:hypothetical protein
MVIDEIENAAGKELKRNLEISRLLCSFGQCFQGETVSRNMAHGSGEDFLLRIWKRLRFRMVL